MKTKKATQRVTARQMAKEQRKKYDSILCSHFIKPKGVLQV